MALNITDYIDDREVQKNYKELNFSDDEETILSFIVPPNLRNIELSMHAEVQNVTTKEL